MSTALSIRHSQTIANTSINDWQVMMEQARTLLQSGFLPQAIKTEAQAVAIILQGRELGIGPMAALGTINVIQGKPTISPQLMLALINRSGDLEDFKCIDDGRQCTLTMKRRGRSAHIVTFSMNDAEKLGLAGKDNWKKQPATMRQWRAVAACARIVFPDVILGLYTPDEMGADVNEDGEIIQPAASVQDFPAVVQPQTVVPEETPSSGASQNKEKKDPVQARIDRIKQLRQRERELLGKNPDAEPDFEDQVWSQQDLDEYGSMMSRRVRAAEDEIKKTLEKNKNK